MTSDDTGTQSLADELKNVYITLLEHPHDLWRLKNQSVYCKLRWLISKETGLTEQEVQESCEDAALPAIFASYTR